MMRTSFTINGDNSRNSVADLVRTLKDGMRVEIKHGRRSPEQSNLMWARLNDIAAQVTWHGQKLEQADWKDMFTAGLRRARVVPNIDGDGFVQLGLHTSDLTKEEMSNLLDLMDAFAANHGVTFKEHSNSSDASKEPPSRDRPDTPAASGPHDSTAAGVTTSDSLGEHHVANGRADAPAGKGPDNPHTAGANPSEASLLSDDWRDTYLIALSGVRDKAASLLTRHAEAIQMIGGDPNEAELAWMRKAWRLVQRRNEAKLKRGEYEAELEKLKSMPLSAAQNAA